MIRSERKVVTKTWISGALCTGFAAPSNADRFGILESSAPSSDSPGGGIFFIVLGLVSVYFGYRWLVHGEETPLLGVFLIAAVIAMAVGVLYFLWVIITK